MQFVTLFRIATKSMGWTVSHVTRLCLSVIQKLCRGAGQEKEYFNMRVVWSRHQHVAQQQQQGGVRR